MLRISADCTFVFPTLETKGFAVGIVSIFQFVAKYKYFRFSSFLAAILNFVVISMVRIGADCAVVFPSLRTWVLQLESCLYLILWHSYKYFRFIPVYGSHQKCPDYINIAH